MNFKAYTGLILSQRRREAGLTLEQLAALSGISQMHIFNIEHGRCDTSAEKLFTLCVCLAIDPQEFLDIRRRQLFCDSRFIEEQEYLSRKLLANSKWNIPFSTL